MLHNNATRRKNMFSPEKLAMRRKELGMSQSKIAALLGINRSSYSRWEKGLTKPNQGNLEELAEILHTKTTTYFESEYDIINNYLQLTPHNQKRADNYVQNLLTHQQDELSPSSLYAYQVLSDIKLAAGLGNGFTDEFSKETVYSDKQFTGFDIAAWIDGDSMEPVYHSGEVALIKTSGFDYDGDIYAISWDERVFIKKLYRADRGFKMVSLNPKYQDRFIPLIDRPQVVGKVVDHFMPIFDYE